MNLDSSKSLTQAALAIFLIDKIWGNSRSVNSTVKIDQSEGIAAPAIPEDRRGSSKKFLQALTPLLALVLPRFFSRSFSLVPNYREPGTGYLPRWPPTQTLSGIFPFVNKRCHFSLLNLRKKESMCIGTQHRTLNPCFLTSLFIPLHYQVDPPIFRKILLQIVTFLNVNDIVAPNNK